MVVQVTEEVYKQPVSIGLHVRPVAAHTTICTRCIAKRSGISPPYNIHLSQVVAEATTLRLSYKNVLKIDNLQGFSRLTKLCLDNNIIESIRFADELRVRFTAVAIGDHGDLKSKLNVSALGSTELRRAKNEVKLFID